MLARGSCPAVSAEITKVSAKLENKILIPFVATIVMVLVIAANMWKASHDAVEAARWLSHSLQILDILADTKVDLYRIESSVRGYLVSANPARLAERDAAISSLNTVLPRIKDLVGGNSRQTERWKQLRAAVDARLLILAHTVMVRQNQGLDAVRDYIASTPQRELARQGAIEILEEMEAEERRLLQDRDLEEKRLRTIATAAALAVTLVIVALLAVTYMLIRRQVAYSRAAREHSEEAALARRALLDAADVAMISVNPEGVILSFNPAAERMLGYAAAELVGSHTAVAFHDPAEIAARARQFSEELGETIAPGFEVFAAKARRNLPNAHEWTYVRKDGARLQVFLSVSAMRDGAGRIVGFLGVATDITGRKKAEERLRESAVRIQSILNTVVDGIITIDEFGFVETLNPAAERMFGYPAAEVVGQNVKMLMPEPYQSEHDAYLERYRTTAQARLIGIGREVVGRRKDGSTFPMELAVSEMQSGAARHFTGLVRDVTARKAAEQALLQESNRLDLALTATGLAMWDADGLSGRVSLDKRWATMMGEVPKPCETTVADLLKLAPLSEQRRLLAAATSALRGRAQEYRVEHQVRTKSGEWRWIESYGKVVERDMQGRALRIIGINADITSRKRAELALAASEAELRLIADHVPAMICHYDKNERCVFGNTAYAAFFGQTASDLSGRPLRSVVGSETYRVIEPFVRKVQQGESAHFERPHRSGTGSERMLAVTLVPDAKNSEGPVGFHVMIIDVTERRQAEEALVAAKNAAEAANRAKDAFLATMSHEIRTPLNGILGMLELLGLSPLNAEQRETLTAARDSGQSLMRIIDDTLDHARIEAGKLEIRLEPVSIARLLQRVANTYTALASAKDLTLRQTTDPRISRALLADPVRVMQILGNFVSNAIKFTAEGHVEIRADLVEREGAANVVRLSVKDTGIGIAPEARERLFRPFEQAEADTSRLYGGTGLGLAISRRLAQMMDGAIDVESAPGEGTTMSVTLTLPISNTAPAEDASSAALSLLSIAKARTALATPGYGARVLAVDDHPINRNLLVRQLATLGLRAQTAADGREALAMWQGGEFALIIVDCNMPVMDGYEFSRAVRDIEAKEGRVRTPIIAWTANTLAAAECHAAGMDDVLIKPSDLVALKEALAKWMPAAAQIIPIDYEQLDKVAADATDRMDILQSFMAQTRSDLAELEAAMRNRDLPTCERIAHRIKGASRMVGARELAAESEAIEKTARQGEPGGTDAVKAAVQRLATHLDEAAGATEEKP